ncbi:oxidoreductase short-chain dehydrogenase/reductase family [Firmicutes bacterium CAG:882]|jgi:short-subunit dehydrogenase|nr:oxidoreductase short-chain dehydrogenase/reductase family [Firmicutes bacterium CAG:882]
MKIAVVTGASSGLGREFARQISARYSKFDEIWLIARRTERLEEVADEIKLTSRVISLDLSSKDELMALKELLEENAPDIKLLVNCAGYGKSGSFDELGYDEQLGMIDINCRALTAVTKLCLPYISSNSRIIELASAAAFMPQPDFAVYAATKSYVLSFSKAINKELKPKKITVTAVCPGPVDTEFFDIAGKNVKLLKRMVMAKPENVVEQAIKDAALGNELSIYGRTMKLAHVAGRFLPHRLLMKFF